MDYCETECHGSRRAWQRKAAHLMVARKQRVRNRKRPGARYTLQSHDPSEYKLINGLTVAEVSTLMIQSLLSSATSWRPSL
jgi:hypothetical protein